MGGSSYTDADDACVERVRRGDRAAFDEIVERYQSSLRALVVRYVKNEEDAKDVAQRAFIRAFEKVDAFRGESSFRTWLFRIAINLALKHVRGAPLLEADAVEEVAAFTSSLATSKLVAAEAWRKVSERLEKLPPKQRLAVELRLFHELSFAEVAAVTDSTEDAAKKAYQHGVKRLREVVPR